MSTIDLDHDVRPAAPAVRPLTSVDRCDAPAVAGGPKGTTARGSCGAQAQLRAVLANGHDLLFCAHHGRAHEAALAAAGATLHDTMGSLAA